MRTSDLAGRVGVNPETLRFTDRATARGWADQAQALADRIFGSLLS